MSYDDWDSSFRDVYDNTPGMGEAYDEDNTFDTSYAESLFEVGFTMHSDELEANGYTMDDVQAIRDEFFDYMGIDVDDFDWQGWREAMGYD